MNEMCFKGESVWLDGTQQTISGGIFHNGTYITGHKTGEGVLIAARHVPAAKSPPMIEVCATWDSAIEGHKMTYSGEPYVLSGEHGTENGQIVWYADKANSDWSDSVAAITDYEVRKSPGCPLPPLENEYTQVAIF